MQTFRMMIVPHTGSWKESNIVRSAEEFNAPALLIYQGIHNGSMPKIGSFLAAESQDIIISAIKLAESGEDLIVRCVETSGVQCIASLYLKFVEQKWKGNFRPYEIKTLRINKRTASIIEVNLLEE